MPICCRPCCNGHRFPHDTEESFIGTLKAGETVIIKKGHGHPPAPQDFRTVIAEVAGSSALTADGTMLACKDDDGVILLLEPKTPVVLSERALKILAETADE